jgi:hypothetical protein
MKNITKYILSGAIVALLIFLFIFESKTGSENIIDLSEIITQQSVCIPQQQVCTVSSDEFSAEIKFDKNITYLKPFNITVKTQAKENHSIKYVHVDFKMKSMDMGINRFNLSNKGLSDENISWEGKALLPVCVTGRVDWFSEVAIITGNKKYIFSFPMEVKKN